MDALEDLFHGTLPWKRPTDIPAEVKERIAAIYLEDLGREVTEAELQTASWQAVTRAHELELQLNQLGRWRTISRASVGVLFFFRLLLEHVQDVGLAGESDRMHGAARAALMALDELQDPGAAEIP